MPILSRPSTSRGDDEILQGCIYIPKFSFIKLFIYVWLVFIFYSGRHIRLNVVFLRSVVDHFISGNYNFVWITDQ